MIPLKVKICGLTSLKDAVTAAEMGADLLGFIFYPKSPRYIEPGKAMEIIRKLPTFLDTVGVFVDPTAEQIRQVNERGCLRWIQLHGDESPEFCRSLHWMNARVIKATRVRNKSDLDRAFHYPVDAFLLDAYVKEKPGGTGKMFDWSFVRPLPHRIFLSGGITPDNVIRAMEAGTYGIDICSGIEAEPGKKDPEKMRRLFENIRLVSGGKVRI